MTPTYRWTFLAKAPDRRTLWRRTPAGAVEVVAHVYPSHRPGSWFFCPIDPKAPGLKRVVVRSKDEAIAAAERELATGAVPAPIAVDRQDITHPDHPIWADQGAPR